MGAQQFSRPTQFWSGDRGAAVLGIIAVVLAVLALLRDATDYTIPGLNEQVDITVTPEPMLLNRCHTLTGTATFPDGADLWVAHKDQVTDEFYLAKATRQGDRGWAAELTIGSDTATSRSYDLFVFFLPHDVGAFVENLSTGATDDAADSYWFARSLPPGVDALPTFSAARSSIPNAGCE